MSCEFFNRAEHVARKPYVCELCGGEIRQGATYVRENGKFDGRLFDRCLHVRCAGFEDEFCSEVASEFIWEEIADYIQETYCGPQCPLYDQDAEECEHSIYSCPRLAEYDKTTKEKRAESEQGGQT